MDAFGARAAGASGGQGLCRLRLFLAEYGWTGPASAFLEVVANRIQAHITSLRDLAAGDPLFARIVTEGGADALEAAVAELAHFT